MRTRNGPSPAAMPRENGAFKAKAKGGEAGQSGQVGQGGAVSHAGTKGRYDRLDALRGLALMWMAAFHFSFDLSNYRLIDADFYTDALWTTQRTCILSLFLLCAGAGQAIATAQGQTWARFWRRWAQISGCALLVSAGSWYMFPHSYIYFGVLHGMAVMLILARLMAPWRIWLWPLGLALLALPRLIAHPFFDTRLTDWVGLVTHKPITEDYVPILPWLGVMLWGLAGTQWLLAHRPGWLAWAQPAMAFSQPAAASQGDNTALAPAAPRIAQVLGLLGRWSLSFYMVHQPVLIGCLSAWMMLTGRPMP